MKSIFSLVYVTILSITLVGCGIQSIPKQANEIEATWAEVMNQYQRRADLVPNLVEAVRGFAKQEKEVLTQVTEARARATQMNINVKDLSQESLQTIEDSQNQLKSALGRLMVIAESYPQLKSDQNFRDLQMQLEGTENRITVARNRYIESVKVFNNLVSVFPTSLTNSLFFHFEKKPQFAPENAQDLQKAPPVKF